MGNIKKEIQHLLNTNPPMTMKSISDELRITRGTAVRCVRDLVDQGIVSEFEAENSGKKYCYIEEEMSNKDVSDMRKVVTEETINVKDTYNDLTEKYEKVSKNVNGLYANIISIIAVFVAIFALITVNANITFKLTTENMYDVFWGIVKMNVFVVICIIAMLGATRILIINPLIKEKKKKKDKRG